jgi:hypothetical protein
LPPYDDPLRCPTRNKEKREETKHRIAKARPDVCLSQEYVCAVCPSDHEERHDREPVPGGAEKREVDEQPVCAGRNEVEQPLCFIAGTEAES